MHSLLEEYLSKVAAQLKLMPTAYRKSEINELRAHLQEAAEINQAAGQGEEEALQAALRQFRPPNQVGRELKRTWMGCLRLFFSVCLILTAGCTASVRPRRSS